MTNQEFIPQPSSGGAALMTNHGARTDFIRPVKGLRFVSGMIDFVFLTMTTIIFSFVSLMVVGSLDGKDGLQSAIIIIWFLFLIMLWLGYGIVMEASRHQGTLGKILTGTVIVNQDGSALSTGQVMGRNAGKFVSFWVPFYIPYLMVLFTENSQSLHDYMARSFVYKKTELFELRSGVFS